MKIYKVVSKRFLIIYLIFSVFLFYRLSTSMFTADSHFWYTRTNNFIQNVKNHKWSETYQNPKPGVTIMWLSGISMDTYFNYYQSKHNFVPYIFSSDIFPRLDFLVKLPLIILCLLSVLDFIFSYPYFNTSQFIRQTKINDSTAKDILRKLTGIIINLEEKGSGIRPNVYSFPQLLDITG